MTPSLPLELPCSLQQLTPQGARFCLAVLNFLQKELGFEPAGQRLLVGLSGGADSSALLLALRCLAEKAHFSLEAAHLNHGLRPSAGAEADYCAALCKRLGVPCLQGKADVAALAAAGKCGHEEAGRAARYDFLARSAQERGCDLIAVGHTADDLAEDILMRLIRGTGWPGLAGMKALDRKRQLLRPLLVTPRKEIEAFLTDVRLGWVTDESNARPLYLRNRLRARLMPLILEENPSFLEAAAGLWRLGRLDENWLDDLLDEAEAGAQPPADTRNANAATAQGPEGDGEASDQRQEFFLRRDSLAALPKALRLRLYKRHLDALGPGQTRLDSLLALDRAFASNPEPTEHRFAGAKRAFVDKTGIALRLVPAP